MNKYTFRCLNIKDVPEIINLGLNKKEFDPGKLYDSWSKEELINLLSSNKDICVGAFENGGNLIGYCFTHLHREISKVHIENLYVKPEFRGFRIGYHLIEYLKKQYVKKYYDKHDYLRFIALVEINNECAIKCLKNGNFTIGEKMFWAQSNISVKEIS